MTPTVVVPIKPRIPYIILSWISVLVFMLDKAIFISVMSVLIVFILSLISSSFLMILFSFSMIVFFLVNPLLSPNRACDFHRTRLSKLLIMILGFIYSVFHYIR